MMNIIISLFPVFLFLLFLVYIDSFKLVKVSDIIISIFAGAVFAVAAYLVNTQVVARVNLSMPVYTRYIAPVIEEFLKALFLFLLIKKNKIGFMIDGSILGFAIGAGFSTVENIYYLSSVDTTNLFVWVIRGLGTAIMHGGTTASAAIIIMGMLGRTEEKKAGYYLQGIAAAIVIHSLYNHFFISPLFSAIAVLVVLPILLSVIFQMSEINLRKWLEVEFDTEAKLIAMINKGMFSETKAGMYLLSIKNKFPQETIVDLLCFIKIYLELSIRAKSILLMKEAGFEMAKDKGLEDKLNEFRFLQKSIGKTGMFALSPVFRFKSKDLWKLNLLK